MADDMNKINPEEFIKNLDYLFDNDKIDEIDGYLKKWLDVAVAADDLEGKVLVLNEMTGFYREMSMKEETNEAVEKLLLLVGGDEGYNDRESVVNGLGYQVHCTSLLNCATAYRAVGKLQEASKLYGRIFRLYDGVIDIFSFEFAEIYNNVALLYQEMGRLDMAEKSLYNALAICKVTPDKEFQTAVTYANLGQTEVSLGKWDKAFKNLKKAIEIFTDKQACDNHHAAALTGVAEVLENAGDIKNALEVYDKALEMIKNYVGENYQYERVLQNRNNALTKLASKGLYEAREAYEKMGAAMIHEKFPEYEARIAVGKAGAGSECFGLDDSFSRDHDFMNGFSMWLTDEDYEKIGDALNEEYWKLFPAENVSEGARSRFGARRISDFFIEYTGYPEGPVTDGEWLMMDMVSAAAAVNGEIFRDDLGKMTAIRMKLRGYYPERVKLTIVAEKATLLGQAAQYNYDRAVKRDDLFTANIEKMKAVKLAMELIYILNSEYVPHDKLIKKGIYKLPVLSDLIYEIDDVVMSDLGVAARALAATIEDDEERQRAIEVARDRAEGIGNELDFIARSILDELKNQKVIFGQSDFLPDYAAAFSRRLSLYNIPKDDLCEEIAKMEFREFDKVKNEGGRATCQDDWETFHIMRKSQYLTWTREMLVQYVTEFEVSVIAGNNMITEKYGRMMESTTPWEFENIKDRLPFVSDRKKALANQIVSIQVKWMEEFAEKYPGLAGNARIIHTKDDKPWDTSYETYLRGELLTYSDTLLYMYGRFVVGLFKSGQNLAFMIMNETIKMYGYKTFEEAQEKNEE